ncbi:MAG: hypothetical protein IJZ35_09035 [Clostridia bacterium]|nr:hypothetical protein [Clostridia bacterium]
MKILFYEIKKIFKPSVLAVVLILYVLAGTLIGPLSTIEYAYNSYNGEYGFDPSLRGGGGKHSETVVKDMLMERYGIALEGEELFDFIDFFTQYSENLNKAIINNEYCKKFGITCADDLMMSAYDILGEEYYTMDENGRIVQLKEDEYSRFFDYDHIMYYEFEYEGKKYIPEIQSWLQSSMYHIQAGFERSGKDYVYYIFDTGIVSTLGISLPILFCASMACAMIAVIPYGVREIRSGITDIQHSSKTGRKIYLYKIGAVLISSAVFMAAGIAVALAYYECIGVDRFDNTMLDSYYGEFDGLFADKLNKVYSQITVAELIKFFSVAVFVLGIVMCIAVYIVSEKFNNPITAAAACIPVFGVMILCGYRYLSGCVYPCNHSLLFKGEGLVVTALFVLACIAVVIIDYRKVINMSF